VNASVVEVAGLRVSLAGSPVDIVDEIDFQIEPAEVVGLVGESGSGKSTIGLALLGHCRRGGEITAGRVKIAGRDMLKLDGASLNAARGHTVAYIPQDPSAALNPALRIGLQLEEMLAVHQPDLDDAQRRTRVFQMLEEVKLPAEAFFLQRYTHQLSGGQQQRVALAMAFACRPAVIVLDEPTTGLDVPRAGDRPHFVRHYGVAALYVSHDLAVVASLADRVLVMYAGRMSDPLFTTKLLGSYVRPAECTPQNFGICVSRTARRASMSSSISRRIVPIAAATASSRTSSRGGILIGRSRDNSAASQRQSGTSSASARLTYASLAGRARAGPRGSKSD
jgi:ABC-type glutathione transport system ATPase component